MLRKSVIALAAVATIGAAALVPTEAAAKSKHKYLGYWVIGTAIAVTTATVASSCWRYGWYRGAYVRWWVCD